MDRLHARWLDQVGTIHDDTPNFLLNYSHNIDFWAQEPLNGLLERIELKPLK